MLDIESIEAETLAGLKDFQRATVDRIDYLYRHGQNRVLVADEVGLGKTLIARGVIARLGKLRREEGDDLFKVVYVCSNQSIANQNIKKLDITGGNAINSVDDTRLSMQHLKIAQQEASKETKEKFIQLMPLTPETSFHMTAGGGSVRERALMFAILRRMDEFKEGFDNCELEKFMMLEADRAWESWAKESYEKRVAECEEQSNKEYPANFIAKIRAYSDFEGEKGIKNQLLKFLGQPKTGGEQGISKYQMMNRLRIMFARISVSMLEPDLVIMDEFQRFKFLLSNDDSELGILAKQFLSGKGTRILLLSATPYKLYSTPEEIDEAQLDEHYAEFFQVMDFLFEGEDKDKTEDKKAKFHTIWKDYSIALSEMKVKNGAVISAKNQAQEAMYQGVCRTERISVMESGDYTDDSSVREPLAIQQSDIISYIQMAQLLKNTNSKYSLPADYVKSCPYLMSFMKNYKLKASLEQYFRANPDKVSMANPDKVSLANGKALKTLQTLWIDEDKLRSYKEVPVTNARLGKLLDQAFSQKAEMYLWVPPSRPYYPLQGVYKNSDGFSKILVFSSWEMVPRMIGSLVSYEAERKTVGRLINQARNQGRKNTTYFADNARRFPAPRLRFNVSNGEPHSMSMFCLLYPSKTLADLYAPIPSINAGLPLSQIEQDIRKSLRLKLDEVEAKYGLGTSAGQEDARWYYLAPMLLDDTAYVHQWISDIKAQMRQDEDTLEATGRGKRNSAFFTHIDRLEEDLSLQNGRLGKRPSDLLDTLVDMVIGSPAVCVYRANGNNEARATALARVFINNFNLPEATAIIDLAYGRSNDNSHWQKVLRYCKDGCFQAMIDEYQHILSEAVGFGNDSSKRESIHNMMMESLRVRTSTYEVDTYKAFEDRVTGKKNNGIRVRSSYAVGFTKDAVDDSKLVNRKESVRNAFNSPMRPFILATTSIGQEGLDFHNYCRKIMHWNLPANPIDLEQREGRINRYKCLAIRQNVAKKYGNIPFENDIWSEMFAEAAKCEKQGDQPELVPFWCFGENQEVKIERIVPMYPVSRDEANYERLIKILSLYRLTLGQARQEELLDYLFKEFDDTENLKDLFIDLSPYSREKAEK